MIEKAKDQYVWDADGNQYLDFFGGIVTVSVGHCNDTVNRKVHAQMDKLQHVSTVFATEPQVALAKKIASLTPGGQADEVVFHQQRHGSQRDGHSCGALLHGRDRDRCSCAIRIMAGRRWRWP